MVVKSRLHPGLVKIFFGSPKLTMLSSKGLARVSSLVRHAIAFWKTTCLINPKMMESSWRMSEARMLSKESLSDLSVCWSLVEDDAVAAEQTDDDARR